MSEPAWGILRLGDAPLVVATAILDPDLSYDNVVGSLRVDITYSGLYGSASPFNNIELTERIAVPPGGQTRYRYRGWVRSASGKWGGTIGSFYYKADGTYNGNQWANLVPQKPGVWTYVDIVMWSLGDNPTLSLIMIFAPLPGPQPAPVDTVWFDAITLADAAVAGEIPSLPGAIFGPGTGGNITGWLYGNNNAPAVIDGNVSFDPTALPYPMATGQMKLAVTGGTGIPAEPLFARDTFDARWPVVPGNSYYVDCLFYCDSAAIAGTMGAGWYDAGGALLGWTYDTPLVVQTTPALTRFSMTAPANAATMELRVGATRLTNTNAVGNVWFGNMQLYDPGGPPPPVTPPDVLPPDSTESAGVLLRVVPPRWSTDFVVVEGYP